MRKLNLLYSLLLLPAIIAGIGSCKKASNTINNGQVVETPYSLYFTDTAGTMYNSNDGKSSKVVFAADGIAARCIFTMNKNLLMAKQSLYVSTNNGANFNYSLAQTYLGIVTPARLNVLGKPLELNQSMAIFAQGWNHAYISVLDPSSYFGFAWNEQDGLNGWVNENYYDTDQVKHPSGLQVTSFTQLKSGMLLAYDAVNRRGLYRAVLTDRWKEMYDPTDPTLPLAVPGGSSFFSMGHINNRMILIDNYGTGGAWYSDNLGTTFTQYAGLPANIPVVCIASPFEQICMVGTTGAGLYTLNANTNSFEKIGFGLPEGLEVRNIAFKENIYKNGRKVQYIYLATNQGIYQSQDLGANWTRTIKGNFVTIY